MTEEFVAKTVEDAINDGLKKMMLERENAEIEILDEGKGIFKKAKVRISKKLTEGSIALEYIEDLIEKMNIKNTVCEMTEDDDKATIVITSVESGTVIGYRGEVLDAIQYMASMVANHNKKNFKRIVVDCENYRQKRLESLDVLAKRLADKAVKLSRKVKLEPMNPYERRVIHSALSQDERIDTVSVGDEPARYIVITPKNYKEGNDRYRNFNKGGRNDRNNKREREEKRPRPADMNKKSSEVSFGTFLGNTREGYVVDKDEE